MHSPVQPPSAFPLHVYWRAMHRDGRDHLLRHPHAPPWRTGLTGGGAGAVQPSCPAEDPTLQHMKVWCSFTTISMQDNKTTYRHIYMQDLCAGAAGGPP